MISTVIVAFIAFAFILLSIVLFLMFQMNASLLFTKVGFHLLDLTLATNYIVLFVPTLYASGGRTFLFSFFEFKPMLRLLAECTTTHGRSFRIQGGGNTIFAAGVVFFLFELCFGKIQRQIFGLVTTRTNFLCNIIVDIFIDAIVIVLIGCLALAIGVVSSLLDRVCSWPFSWGDTQVVLGIAVCHDGCCLGEEEGLGLRYYNSAVCME